RAYRQRAKPIAYGWAEKADWDATGWRGRRGRGARCWRRCGCWRRCRTRLKEIRRTGMRGAIGAYELYCVLDATLTSRIGTSGRWYFNRRFAKLIFAEAVTSESRL